MFSESELQSAEAAIEYEGDLPTPYRYGRVVMKDSTYELHIPLGYCATYITEGYNNIVCSVKVADNSDIDSFMDFLNAAIAA